MLYLTKESPHQSWDFKTKIFYNEDTNILIKLNWDCNPDDDEDENEFDVIGKDALEYSIIRVKNATKIPEQTLERIIDCCSDGGYYLSEEPLDHKYPYMEDILEEIEQFHSFSSNIPSYTGQHLKVSLIYSSGPIIKTFLPLYEESSEYLLSVYKTFSLPIANSCVSRISTPKEDQLINMLKKAGLKENEALFIAANRKE